MLEFCGALLPPAGNAGNRTARMTLCYPRTPFQFCSLQGLFMSSTSHGAFVHLVHRTVAPSGSTTTPSSSFSTHLRTTGKMLAQHIRTLDQHVWSYRWDPTDDMKRSQSEELQTSRNHLKGFIAYEPLLHATSLRGVRTGPGSETGTNRGWVWLNVT